MYTHIDQDRPFESKARNTYIYIYINTRIHTNTHTCMHKYTCIHIYTCTHVFILTLIMTDLN